MISSSGGSRPVLAVLCLSLVIIASGCTSPGSRETPANQSNMSSDTAGSPVILSGHGDGWYCGSIKVNGDAVTERYDALIDAARDSGMSFVGLMINHSDGKQGQQLDVCDHLTRSGLLCVPGLVWGQKEMFAALGTDESPPANISIEGAINNVHRAGGLVILSRPMSENSNQSWKRWDISSWDGIAVVSPMFQRIQSDHKAVEKWHNFLNNGHKKLAFGETDVRAFGNTYSLRNMIDSSYQCVRVSENLTQESLLEALRSGSSYVTNGPAMEFTVNGAGIGEEINVSSGDEVEVFLNVSSSSVFNTVKITRNGDVIQEIGKPLNSFSTNLTSTVLKDTWFSAEVWGGDFTPDYHDPVHAISNPIWVRA